MADVFVSYCREDSTNVARLISALKGFGLSISYDELFQRGEDFEDRILTEIDSAGAVVVCWSDAAAKSKWVRDEAREAQRQNKYVGCQIAPGGAGFGFDTINHDDLCRWRGEGRDLAFLRLVSHLGKLLGRDELAGLEGAERARLADEEQKQRDAEAERRRQAEVQRQLEAARLHAQQEREAELRRKEAERRWTFEQKTLAWLRPYSLWLNPLVVAFGEEAYKNYILYGNGPYDNYDIFTNLLGPLMNYSLSFKIVLAYSLALLLWLLVLRPFQASLFSVVAVIAVLWPSVWFLTIWLWGTP
jgi:hypothetical protein